MTVSLSKNNLTRKKRRWSSSEVQVVYKKKAAPKPPNMPIHLSKKVALRLKVLLPPPPWTLRIHKQIFDTLRPEIDKDEVCDKHLMVAIRKNMAFLTDRYWYHKAILTQPYRVSLTGKREQISKKHKVYAKKRLESMKKNKK